jgi:hypothetical protein
MYKYSDLILDHLELLSSYKSRGVVPLECENCGAEHLRMKKIVQVSIRRGDKHCFCSRGCLTNYYREGRGVIRQCGTCGKEVARQLCETRKSHLSFCNSSCSAKYNNRHRSEKSRVKQALAASKTLKNKISTRTKLGLPRHSLSPYTLVSKCVVCNFWFEGRRKTCSGECLRIRFVEAGKYAASVRVLRSRDETKLYELCSSKYEKVTHNEVLVNGWDADIAIYDTKTAILWNGPWHYKDMPGLKHSLRQVQNRDRIKVKELTSLGWKVLIFEDRIYTPESAFFEILKLAGT